MKENLCFFRGQRGYPFSDRRQQLLEEQQWAGRGSWALRSSHPRAMRHGQQQGCVCMEANR